ncbi:MAG: helix-turn-helix transcriptional regulator [Sphingomonadaceae bacterium]|nr:helix-turn-helix transcriptional regulator [Sphingomonadaceae bacterium]
MSAVTLDYASPDALLRDRISLFYEFRANVPLFEDVERADLAQFRFVLEGGEGEYRFADGHVAPTPRIQIIGPTTGPTSVRAEGPIHMFGAGLLPAGWAQMLDFEASLLVNRVIDAVDLFGPRLLKAAGDLRAAGTLDEKVRIGAALVHELIGRGKSEAFDFTRVVDDWLASSPSPDVDELVRASRVSRRQVERNCKRFYGSPPKVLARKYRALKAAISLAKHEAVTEDLLDHGFYDQSHFIREIKHFTGVTPKTIADGLPTLATLTLKRTAFVELSPLVTGT